MPLSIVSYNIHSGIGIDGQFSLSRIAEVLREIDADVVCLQECGDFRGRTNHRAHAEALALLLGMDMAFGPNVVRNERRFGNAILSRLTIVQSQNYDLSHGNREPRGALRCDLQLGDEQTLHVFSVHLGLGVRERRAQEARLLSHDIFLDAARREPLVVCGDFNYLWSRPVPALLRRKIHDAALELGHAQKTYPTRFPLFRLDRMFVDAGIKPLSVRAHRTPLALKSSDHLPLVMEFESVVRQRQSQLLAG